MPKPQLVKLPEAARKEAASSLKRYFVEELDQEIGDLKATLVLDYVLAEIGPAIYNQAIADAHRFFEGRLGDLEGLAFPAEFPYWKSRKRE